MSKHVCIMFVSSDAAGGNDRQPELSATEPDTKIGPGKIYLHL